MLNDLGPELQRMMDGDDRFFLSVTGDPISIEVQLTPEQVRAMLLDAPDPLILQVISEVLQERGTLAVHSPGTFRGSDYVHTLAEYNSQGKS